MNNELFYFPREPKFRHESLILHTNLFGYAITEYQYIFFFIKRLFETYFQIERKYYEFTAPVGKQQNATDQ